MTLYAKEQDDYREATEAEILSAYSRVMRGRRKSRKGGRPPVLDARKRARALALLAKGKTQTEVAVALGCAQATISKLSREG